MSDAAPVEAGTSEVGSGSLLDALQSVQLDEPTESQAVNEVVAEAPTEVNLEQAADGEPAQETAPSEPEDPFETYLKELEAEPPDDDAVEDAEALKELAENPNSRARKRIQKLANQKKEAQEKAQAAEAQLTKLQETVDKQAKILRQQLAQQMQFQQQMQQPKGPVETLSQSQAQAQPGTFEELMGHLSPRLEAEFEKRVAPLQQKLDAYEQREAQARQQAEYAQQVAQIEQQAASVRHMVIPGLPEEAYQDPDLAAYLDEIVITKSVAENRPVTEVVPDVKKTLARLTRAMTNAARQRGKQLAEAPKAPKIGTQAVAAKESQGFPLYSTEQLVKAGYRGTTDAFRDGWSKLKGTEPQDGWS